MAGLLIFVGENAMELDPMATVADIREKLPQEAKKRKLYYQTKELHNESLLADLGIGSEARVELGMGNPIPVFNETLPHKFTDFQDDNKQAEFIGDGNPTCVFGKEAIEDGVEFWFHIVKEPQGSYYGVGLSPMPKDPSTAQKTRIANDGNGIGWSFNRNGCCYGDFARNPMEGMCEGRDPGLLEGDFVKFQVTFSSGELIIEHIMMNEKHTGEKPQVRTKTGSIGKSTKQPLYPAVFFCNKKHSVIRFVEGPDDDRIAEYVAASKAREAEREAEKERQLQSEIQELLAILGSDYDKQKIRRALEASQGDKEKAMNSLLDG